MTSCIPEAAGAIALATDTVRRRTWQEQGIAILPVVNITDLWLRKAVTSEAACCLWPRNRGHGYDR
jgi:hypothetical protein